MDMQLDEVRELGVLWKNESYRPNTPSPPSRFKESSPSGGLGRLTCRLASASGIAPPLKERDCDSDCLHMRRRFFPHRGNDLRHQPTTIGHRPGLSGMPQALRCRASLTPMQAGSAAFGRVRRMCKPLRYAGLCTYLLA